MVIFYAVAATLVTGLSFLGYSYAEARSDPVVRETRVALPDWPRQAAPVRLVLVSDLHIGSPAMDATRLTSIVGQINALHPDLVLLAGDYIYNHRPHSAARIGAAMVAPLAQLHAPLGTIAVLGNHDWMTGADAVRSQLAEANIRVLENSAIQLGPLALGGIGDQRTGHADVATTLAAMHMLPGAPVLLTHSPDIAPELPIDMPLLLAGHTHCGQIVLPLYGPLASVTRFGERYRCGLRREGMRTVIVTAGLGASGAPLRFGAPPDLWLITLAPTG